MKVWIARFVISALPKADLLTASLVWLDMINLLSIKADTGKRMIKSNAKW